MPTPPPDMERVLEATSKAEHQHFWYSGFRRFVRPLLEEAVRGIEQPRLVDCGCGTGSNVETLAPYGEAFGFDYTWRGLHLGLRGGRSRLAQATVAAIPFPTDHFDVVTSFDVLGVLPDAVEQAALREMFRILKPGGAAVINVAAMEILRGDHATLNGEVRRYSRRQLAASLQGAGFTIARLTHTNASLFPLMLATRGWERVRGLRSQSSDMELPHPIVNAALASLLVLESKVIRVVSMPAGSSLLCLARKPAR